MTWQTTAPNGTKSVRENNAILQSNTTYINTTQVKDHYWNDDPKSGHHKAMQLENYAATATGAPTTPTLADGMSLAIFGLLNGSYVEPTAKNSSGLMQLLGIRAYAVWNLVAGGDPTPQSLVNSFNVTSVNLQMAGIFAVTYSTALPTNNYAVFCGGMSPSANTVFNMLVGSVASGLTVADRKNTGGCITVFQNITGIPTNPLQGWFLAFGG